MKKRIRIYEDTVVDGKARVMTIHHQPHLIPPEKLDLFIEVDASAVPTAPPETAEGEHAVLYMNLDTNQLFYEIETID